MRYRSLDGAALRQHATARVNRGDDLDVRGAVKISDYVVLSSSRATFRARNVLMVMERFYFDLDECGSVTIDPDGRELRDIDEANSLAIKSARAMMCSELSDGHLCLSCHIDIRTAAGVHLRKVSFRDAVHITGW